MDDVTLSATIMAHPDREGYVDDTLDRLPAGRVEVVWDRYDDRWDTGRRALAAYDPAATHHLVLQDDAWPCSKFFDVIDDVLEHVPVGHPVSLFQGRGRTKPRRFHFRSIYASARSRRAPFLVYGGPWWGQAVVVPTSHVRPIILWGDTHPKIENYDHKIATWYHAHGVDCWYTLPSLVQHLTDGPSLVPGRSNTSGRRALWYHPRPVRRVDWSKAPYVVADEWDGWFPPTPHAPGWLDVP